MLLYLVCFWYLCYYLYTSRGWIMCHIVKQMSLALAYQSVVSRLNQGISVICDCFSNVSLSLCHRSCFNPNVAVREIFLHISSYVSHIHWNMVSLKSTSGLLDTFGLNIRWWKTPCHTLCHWSFTNLNLAVCKIFFARILLCQPYTLIYGVINIYKRASWWVLAQH